MNVFQIIKRPLITEKGTDLRMTQNAYQFEVAIDADKLQIRRAVEKLFEVNVVSVRTQVYRGKVKRMGRTMGKRPNWKKAIVRLRDGDSIQLFEGV